MLCLVRLGQLLAQIHLPCCPAFYCSICILHCALLCELNDDDDDELGSKLVRYVINRGLYFEHMNSLIGRNAVFCSLRYGIYLNHIIYG